MSRICRRLDVSTIGGPPSIIFVISLGVEFRGGVFVRSKRYFGVESVEGRNYFLNDGLPLRDRRTDGRTDLDGPDHVIISGAKCHNGIN